MRATIPPPGGAAPVAQEQGAPAGASWLEAVPAPTHAAAPALWDVAPAAQTQAPPAIQPAPQPPPVEQRQIVQLPNTAAAPPRSSSDRERRSVGSRPWWAPRRGGAP